MTDAPVPANTSEHHERNEHSSHSRWPHRLWHYPFMPIVVLIRIRPSASARAWFLWGTITSALHGVLILFFFGFADTLPSGLLAWLVQWYPLIGSCITFLQVKSIGERPPSAERWDKWDNRTSYIPISAWVFVIGIYLTKTFVLHFSFSKSWWGLGDVVVNFLPNTLGEIYSCYIVALFLAASDMAMIDIQYLISRALGRVTPS